MTLNKNTKKAQYYINRYFHCDTFSLYGLYNKPSSRKVSIAENIERNAHAMGFHDIRYLCGSSFSFTVAYSDRAKTKLIVETICNTYEINL